MWRVMLHGSKLPQVEIRFVETEPFLLEKYASLRIEFDGKYDEQEDRKQEDQPYERKDKIK